MLPCRMTENPDMAPIGERAYYLSLALDARRALNAIRGFSRGSEPSDELKDSLRSATESLRAIAAHESLYAKLSPEHYVQFEEIQTLREVSSSIDCVALLRTLESLLSEDSSAAAAADLTSARKFFRALESRALHHYYDPGSHETVMA